MTSAQQQLIWLRLAGLVACAGVGVALAFAPMYSSREIPRSDYIGWTIAEIVFFIAYWRASADLERSFQHWRDYALLVILSLAALAVCYFSESGMGAILMMVVAGLLPWRLSMPGGVAWLVTQYALMVPVFTYASERITLNQSILFTALFASFAAFIFVTAEVARRQLHAKLELRKVNSELRATQALLTDSARLAERLRISRELHDLIGHHLTALSLNLEVTSHLVSGKALEQVLQAQSVAKLLLADVREVVSDMRREDTLDLGGAVRNLVEGVPSPRVHLSVPEQFAVEDPQRAQVLLRCLQETITNSMRHAQADNLWIELKESAKGIQFKVRDDGRGVD